jgi:hypothetical protein
MTVLFKARYLYPHGTTILFKIEDFYPHGATIVFKITSLPYPHYYTLTIVSSLI